MFFIQLTQHFYDPFLVSPHLSLLRHIRKLLAYRIIYHIQYVPKKILFNSENLLFRSPYGLVLCNTNVKPNFKFGKDFLSLV